MSSFHTYSAIPTSPLASQSTPPSSPSVKKQLTLPCPAFKQQAFNCTPPSSPTLKVSKKQNLTLQLHTGTTAAGPVSGLASTGTAKGALTVSRTTLGGGENKPPSPTVKPASRRVKLGPGCSLLDWIRLCRSKKDLALNGGKPRTITEEELAKHNTREDAWTAIRGKVYNLTPYMKFHPGGVEELLRGAGKDCTILFDEVHKWVNIESMMKACCIGTLVVSPKSSNTLNKSGFQRSYSLKIPKPVMIIDGINKQAVPARRYSDVRRKPAMAAQANEEVDGVRQVSPESPSKLLVPVTPLIKPDIELKQEAEDVSVALNVPIIRQRKTSDTQRPNPRFDWIESEKYIILHITTQPLTVKKSDVILDVNDKIFEGAIFMNDWVYNLNIALTHSVEASQVQISAGRVDISLKKKNPSDQWENLGTFLEGHGTIDIKNRRVPKYRHCTLESITTVTHDTKVFSLRLPAGSHINVPTGHHLSIKANLEGEEVIRSYTPVCTLTQTGALRHPPPAPASSAAMATTSTPPIEGDTIDLMIKLYKDGKMSQYLNNLSKGDKVLLSDPDSTCTFDGTTKLSAASDILLIAAGSGFTPMVKVLRDVLSSQQTTEGESCVNDQGSSRDHHAVCPAPPSSSSKNVKLIFANKTEKDIIWREELDQVIKASNGRFKVEHILSQPSDSWTGRKGRVDRDIISSHLPPVPSPSLANQKNPSNGKTLVCVCGQTPFTTAISNYLLDMDYPTDIHCFT